MYSQHTGRKSRKIPKLYSATWRIWGKLGIEGGREGETEKQREGETERQGGEGEKKNSKGKKDGCI